MLEVNSIYLYRNRKQVFKDFSLNLKIVKLFRRRRKWGGKMSLNMISGLINPDKGSIKICTKNY